MTRKKVKLAFIENNTARKTTYNKRKKGLLKKVDEISTLCGIDACAIVYGPYDPQPEIWPSPSGVEKVLTKFKAVPEFDQSRRMVDQESFLKQRIGKAEKQLKRQWADNKEKETTMLMFQCLNAGNVEQNDMSMDVLKDLSCIIDHNLRKIGRRIESGDSENVIHQNKSESQVMAAQSQVQ
ncbi:agamous-like MADS-box protein AGL80 [Vicia villosa]|uniref:agamous-like MADS-box protein AGL80 n=1 Tax=Vicia villosa TaxID=3911 RepID=UPI00273AAA74|nr:agamous-like MADS-box protein AGL80 [Vicia villosa]